MRSVGGIRGGDGFGRGGLRQHADELLRFAATLVGPALAEDVLSGAVLRTFSSPSWPSVRSPRPSLFRAVLNEARQVSRSQRRRVLRETAVAAHEAVGPGHVRVEVLDALRRLTLRARAVVFLVFWMDLSMAEVAEAVHVSRSTEERELRVARTRLKGWLR